MLDMDTRRQISKLDKEVQSGLLHSDDYSNRIEDHHEYIMLCDKPNGWLCLDDMVARKLKHDETQGSDKYAQFELLSPRPW